MSRISENPFLNAADIPQSAPKPRVTPGTLIDEGIINIGKYRKQLTENECIHVSSVYQHEIFPTPESFIDRLAEESKLDRQLYMAFLFDEPESRLWSNHPHRICCADGRLDDVRYMELQKSHRRFAQEYDPQAGIMLLKGVSELKTIAELDDYYATNSDEINQIFHFRFTNRIREEMAWQKNMTAEIQTQLARTESGSAEEKELLRKLDIIKNKVYRILLESHSSSGAYLEVLNNLGVMSVSPQPTPLSSFAAPQAPTVEDLEKIQYSAQNGCGAMGSSMIKALEETAKEAYLINLWLHDSHIRPSTGEERLNFSAAELAKIEIVRTHNFTSDGGRLVLAKELDDKALDEHGNLIALTDELRLMAKQFTPKDPNYRPAQARESHEVLKHSYLEHDEQVVRVSLNHAAFTMREQSALEMGWSPDKEFTAEIITVLLNIVTNNFGRHHPEAPIFLHIDATYDPGYIKQVEWVNSPFANQVRAAYESKTPFSLNGETPHILTPLDIIQLGDSDHEKRAIHFKKVSKTESKVNIDLRNHNQIEMRDNLLENVAEIFQNPALASIHDRVWVILSTTNSSNLKTRIKVPFKLAKPSEVRRTKEG